MVYCIIIFTFAVILVDFLLMVITGKRSRQGVIYCVFRAYVRFVHDKFLYRKVYRLGIENIPPDGTPVLIACNHQNCLCDPLGILFAFKDRKPSFLVRADVFSVSPLISKILHKMGLLPAYRLSFDGEASLEKNKETFDESERELLDGRTILMFPEGMHQDRHYLGDFSLAYLRMAFEAAEKSEFKTEIFILPACNHYSAYRDIQNDMLVKFGKPISLKPFYELYKTKPRTAQRQVNVLVHEQIAGMMLDITDTDNYAAFDILRNTYGFKYSSDHGYKSDFLPDKLTSDKMLLSELEKEKVSNQPIVQDIYDSALKFDAQMRNLKIRNENFEKPLNYGVILLKIIAIVALFPLWIFSLWPNILIYFAPNPIMKRIKDKMFYNSFLFGLSVLITMPVLYTLTFVLTGIFFNWLIALVYALALPWLGMFAWYYGKMFCKTVREIRCCRLKGTDEFEKLKSLKKTIYTKLNNILNKEKK